MNKYVKRYAFPILGVTLGALGGYLYYYYVGCSNGSCLITSKPLNSTLYGAVMGGLFMNILTSKN